MPRQPARSLLLIALVKVTLILELRFGSDSQHQKLSVILWPLKLYFMRCWQCKSSVFTPGLKGLKMHEVWRNTGLKSATTHLLGSNHNVNITSPGIGCHHAEIAFSSSSPWNFIASPLPECVQKLEISLVSFCHATLKTRQTGSLHWHHFFLVKDAHKILSHNSRPSSCMLLLPQRCDEAQCVF